MHDEPLTFNRGAVRPIQCIGDGWALIKDQYWLFLGITGVGVLIASAVPMGILLGPMMCGIYLCLLRQARGKPVKFEMLFKGFDDFAQSLIATLIMMVPVFLTILPAYIAFVIVFFSAMPKQGQNAPPNPDATATIAIAYVAFLLFVMLVSVVLTVLFFFIYPLIVDKKVSGGLAVTTSFKAALGNLGGLIGLVLLLNLMSVAGVLACYVGAILVLPIHVAAVAVAYRQVFPDGEEPMSAERNSDEIED